MTPVVWLMCTLHIPIDKDKKPRYSCIFTGVHLILINCRLQIIISTPHVPFILYNYCREFCIKSNNVPQLIFVFFLITFLRESGVISILWKRWRLIIMVIHSSAFDFFYHQKVPSQRTVEGTLRWKAPIPAVESQPILPQPSPSTPWTLVSWNYFTHQNAARKILDPRRYLHCQTQSAVRY